MDEDRGEPEAQLDELQQDADRLGEHVEAARKDWEAKKADPAVPGADGDPKAGEGEGDVPGGEIDPRDPANEDL